MLFSKLSWKPPTMVISREGYANGDDTIPSCIALLLLLQVKALAMAGQYHDGKSELLVGKQSEFPF